MPALTFGLPNKQHLVCSSPICTDLATYVAHVGNKEEILACDVHLSALTIGKRLMKLEKLKEPGERAK